MSSVAGLDLHVTKRLQHCQYTLYVCSVQMLKIDNCSFSDFQLVLKHEDDSTLLRAYISEWSKFFTQCNYLPKPFGTLESNLQGKAGGGTSKRPLTDGITVQKVCILLDYKQSPFPLSDSHGWGVF